MHLIKNFLEADNKHTQMYVYNSMHNSGVKDVIICTEIIMNTRQYLFLVMNVINVKSFQPLQMDVCGHGTVYMMESFCW